MFLSISKYYNSHITVTSNHERYISYIGSNNFVSMSKNKGYYFSSTPVLMPSPMPVLTLKPTHL